MSTYHHHRTSVSLPRMRFLSILILILNGATLLQAMLLFSPKHVGELQRRKSLLASGPGARVGQPSIPSSSEMAPFSDAEATPIKSGKSVWNLVLKVLACGDVHLADRPNSVEGFLASKGSVPIPSKSKSLSFLAQGRSSGEDSPSISKGTVLKARKRDSSAILRLLRYLQRWLRSRKTPPESDATTTQSPIHFIIKGTTSEIREKLKSSSSKKNSVKSQGNFDFDKSGSTGTNFDFDKSGSTGTDKLNYSGSVHELLATARSPSE